MSDIKNKNPIELFNQWLAEAKNLEINDPNAVALATANKDGQPSLRMVLLKTCRSKMALHFILILKVIKALIWVKTQKAAMLFHWKSLRRQIRIEGSVTMVSDQQADIYFASRDRQSRIGAWASKQSRPLESKFALEKAVAKNAAKYGVGHIPRPKYWSGFTIAPMKIEFWQDGAFRLHDRYLFTKPDNNYDNKDQYENSQNSLWQCQRLYP